MKLLRDWPIRRKMTVVVFLTSGLVIAVACAALFLFQLESFRQQVTEDLTALARIVAANSSAAVVFRDKDAATEADFAGLQVRLVRFYSGVLALVLGVSLVLAIVLSRYFQALLTKPILRLAGTARAIVDKKDYSGPRSRARTKWVF